MSEHPDLVGLLRGELGNSEAVAAGDHVAACRTCQTELTDAVVGHALLTRAAATLGGAERLPAPPPLSVPRVTRGRSRPLLVLAAAAALVVGLGAAGTAWWRADHGATPPAEPVSIALQPLHGEGGGAVRMTPDGALTRMTITLHGLPAAPRGDFYEAWLLDPATNKMLPLGQLTDAGGAFDLAPGFVTAYTAVDVSLEADDGDPGHSRTSVLRGRYDPTT